MDSDFPTPTYIQNHDAVLAAYGYWPSFHDAPLLSFEHDLKTATVSLAVHTAEMTAATDERGHVIGTKHHLISFMFSGVEDVVLQQFVIPNTIFEMIFSPPLDFESVGSFIVEVESVLGGDCTMRFSAAAGEVVSVIPRDNWPARELFL